MIERIFHVYKKIKTVGITRFYYAAKARIRTFQYIPRSKKKKRSIGKKAESGGICPYVMQPHLESNSLRALANAYAKNQFSILGSRPACYLRMPWYRDVRLEQSSKNEAYSFDIKVPWELARFQYAPILAHAYRATKCTTYLESLKNQISTFLDAAPFSEGIHWKNPMEVAIRATNWIITYQIVPQEFQKDANFHERLVRSLWEHMHFIENNWELYDGRTNNHYLSNLVGYGYLCLFFDDRTRWKHCWKEIQSEFAWQIQNDGSSYEGSTAYHQLVTELFVHGFLVAKEMGEPILDDVRTKITKMIHFADATYGLSIGDDDSGSLLHPSLYDRDLLCTYLEIENQKKYEPVIHYHNFGLSIIKTDPWHISLRHHAYHPRQPTAHFHEDVGSVTLSYQGIPILVDPGTYLYTGSKKWRNYLRSVAQHSTFYPVGWNQTNDDLFALAISQAEACYISDQKSMQTHHSLYGYPVSRKIAWTENEVVITDDISNASGEMEWSFVFAPAITLEEKNDGWAIYRDGLQLLFLHSDLVLPKRNVWVSPSYGVKQKSWALHGTLKGIHKVSTLFKVRSE